MTLLSIIIPIYNSERTINRTLESLNKLSLESKDVTEVIIIDDGSTDRSMEIVEARKGRLSPLHIIIIRQANRGVSAARNVGLKNSRGKWILFLDSDDELALDPVPYLLNSFEYTAIAFAVKFFKNSKPAGKLKPVHISSKNHLDIFTAGNAITLSSIVFKLEKIQRPFDEDIKYLEDWLFWIENSGVFEKMRLYSNAYSAFIHAYGGNRSADYVMAGRYRRKIVEKVFVEYGEELTDKQKNNLLIQSYIGMIMQGERIACRTFLLLPCSLKLYSKLIVYYMLKQHFEKIDIYGR
ncbi:MAG TPA: hypothetical protein DD725_03920 [Deltaproteobacteria bacterium]|nr:hypothetical protein [Deltaproteobacteria bacterium]